MKWADAHISVHQRLGIGMCVKIVLVFGDRRIVGDLVQSQIPGATHTRDKGSPDLVEGDVGNGDLEPDFLWQWRLELSPKYFDGHALCDGPVDVVPIERLREGHRCQSAKVSLEGTSHGPACEDVVSEVGSPVYARNDHAEPVADDPPEADHYAIAWRAIDVPRFDGRVRRRQRRFGSPRGRRCRACRRRVRRLAPGPRARASRCRRR